MKRMRQKLLVAASCLVCAVVCWKSVLMFNGTEFGAGTLARNEGLGGLLFLLAPILAFKLPRAAAISALVACFVSLPLFLYLVFPRPFRQVWPGLWKGSDFPRETFIWDGWWITGILFMALVACIYGCSLIRGITKRNSLEVGR
jgi:hypothetical protein